MSSSSCKFHALQFKCKIVCIFWKFLIKFTQQLWSVCQTTRINLWGQSKLPSSSQVLKQSYCLRSFYYCNGFNLKPEALHECYFRNRPPKSWNLKTDITFLVQGGWSKHDSCMKANHSYFRLLIVNKTKNWRLEFQHV